MDGLTVSAARLAGKTPAAAKKDDKIKAAQSLKKNGAFQILESGGTVSAGF